MPPLAAIFVLIPAGWRPARTAVHFFCGAKRKEPKKRRWEGRIASCFVGKNLIHADGALPVMLRCRSATARAKTAADPRGQLLSRLKQGLGWRVGLVKLSEVKLRHF